jgi:catechol 2,3-dioxygenase-like lactoylglutathione lyase family enzyme
MTTDDYPVFPAAFHAGIVTARYHETWDFYTTHLGFRTVEERDHWIRLQHVSGAQLLLLREEAGHTPADLVSANRGHGWWLTLEVADPGVERAALRDAGVPVHVVPTARWWRAGSFAVRDPNGVLVIITPRASLVRPSVAMAVESAA